MSPLHAALAGYAGRDQRQRQLLGLPLVEIQLLALPRAAQPAAARLLPAYACTPTQAPGRNSSG